MGRGALLRGRHPLVTFTCCGMWKCLGGRESHDSSLSPFVALGELRVAYSRLPGRNWKLVRAPPCRPPHAPEHVRSPGYVVGSHPAYSASLDPPLRDGSVDPSPASVGRSPCRDVGTWGSGASVTRVDRCQLHRSSPGKHFSLRFRRPGWDFCPRERCSHCSPGASASGLLGGSCRVSDGGSGVFL